MQTWFNYISQNMALKDKRKLALNLREQEMSYSQIKNKLKVSKGTLSYWLRDYPLTKKRISELRDRNETRIKKFRETMKEKKNKRLENIYKYEKKNIFPIKKRELYLCGLFLYWGEGSKTHPADLNISNTDPALIKFFIFWLTKILNVPKTKLKIYLHLYEDMHIEQTTEYWSKILNIPTIQFVKPYIKKNLLKNINHKGGFGHGTCNVKIGDARLTERIIMSIKAIRDNFINMRP